MKKVVLLWLVAAVIAVELFAGIDVVSINENNWKALSPLKVENGEFGYYSNHTKKTAYYNFFYDEKWFEDSAEKFNLQLAKMSIRLAMSAAETNSANVRDLLQKLKFSNEKMTVSYPVPTTETIGYIIGSKSIKKSTGATYDLVVLAVRGGGYGAEWADNFNVGDSGHHLGFMTRAETIGKALSDYIDAQNLRKEKVKIWITGYSRGAAVTNILSHSLSEIYGNEDVFAYCFECPRTITETETENVDKNIFNIVNDIDFVTYMAPGKWGFGRYGVECSLPSAVNTDEKIYAEAKKQMSLEYGKIFAAANGKTFKGKNVISYSSEERENQADFIRDFFDGIANGLTRTDAEKNLFPEVRKIISDSISQNGLVIELGSLNSKNLFMTLVDGAPGALLAFLKYGENLNTAPEVFKVLLQSHYQELCLAWMDTVSTLEHISEVQYNLKAGEGSFSPDGTCTR